VPTKKKVKKKINKYDYVREGKPVSIKEDFFRDYWIVNMSPQERQAITNGTSRPLIKHNLDSKLGILFDQTYFWSDEAIESFSEKLPKGYAYNEEIDAIVDDDHLVYFTSIHSFKNQISMESFMNLDKIDSDDISYILRDHNVIRVGNNYYRQEDLHNFLSELDNPEFFYQEGMPLIIKDNKHILALAPMTDDEDEDFLPVVEDEITINFNEYETVKDIMKVWELKAQIKSLGETPIGSNQPALLHQFIRLSREKEEKEEAQPKPTIEKIGDKCYSWQGVTKSGKPSDKVWEIFEEDGRLKVTFGTRGTNLQTRDVGEYSEEAMEKRIKKKLKEGYAEDDDPSACLKPQEKPKIEKPILEAEALIPARIKKKNKAQLYEELIREGVELTKGWRSYKKDELLQMYMDNLLKPEVSIPKKPAEKDPLTKLTIPQLKMKIESYTGEWPSGNKKQLIEELKSVQELFEKAVMDVQEEKEEWERKDPLTKLTIPQLRLKIEEQTGEYPTGRKKKAEWIELYRKSLGEAQKPPQKLEMTGTGFDLPPEIIDVEEEIINKLKEKIKKSDISLIVSDEYLETLPQPEQKVILEMALDVEEGKITSEEEIQRRFDKVNPNLFSKLLEATEKQEKLEKFESIPEPQFLWDDPEYSSKPPVSTHTLPKAMKTQPSLQEEIRKEKEAVVEHTFEKKAKEEEQSKQEEEFKALEKRLLDEGIDPESSSRYMRLKALTQVDPKGYMTFNN